MADETVPAADTDPFAYTPGVTLGRAGYQETPIERLHRRANQLDALLMVLSSADEDEDGAFWNFNGDIKRTVLELASSLATEVNELQDEVSKDVFRRDASQGAAA